MLKGIRMLLNAASREIEVSHVANARKMPLPQSVPLSAQDREQIVQLCRKGQKIQAIKLYRTLTSVGLKEAKSAVENLEMESRSTHQNEVEWDELHRLLVAGKKIQAIKYYRETTGVGLKEAKEAVEWLERQMQQEF